MAQMKVRTDIFQESKVILSGAPEEQVSSVGLVDIDVKGIHGVIKSEPKALQKMEFFHVFNCDVCSYGTDGKIQLEEHKRIHKNRLQCDICKKVFKFERSLIRHSQKHIDDLFTKENSYKCDICNKVYKYERTLNRHKQQHGAESTGMNINNLNKKDHMVTASDQLPSKKRAREFIDDKSDIADEKYPLSPKKRQKEFIDENSNNVDQKCLMNAVSSSSLQVPNSMTKLDEKQVNENSNNVDKKCLMNASSSSSLQVPYSMTKLEQVTKQMVTLPDVRSGIHKCDICGKICKYERTLRRHRQKQHATGMNIKGNDSKWPLFTPSSQARYQLPKPTVARSGASSHACTVCRKTYNRKGALTRHMKTVHAF